MRLTWLMVVGAVLAFSATASAHIERPSYWPDPDPEVVDGYPVGGKVPKARSLGSVFDDEARGQTFVVCQADSLERARDSIATARAEGYRLRPSQPRLKLSARQAKRMLARNERLAERCAFDSVQAAINAAGNHDRVVILPGRYLEPESRAQPTNDPRCAQLTQLDSGGARTPSFEYQVTCPNDQNLIYVHGRAVSDAPPPSPPLTNRQGIPDEGPCVRCGLQIEGTGALPEDVILDGGNDYVGEGPEARPQSYAKHVVLRIDRADGIVVKNLLTRGASEHGIYVEETDGYRLDRVKFFWAADYGNLTFTSDHGLYTDCDGFGAGDAVVYPGASPETGEQVDRSFNGSGQRINTTVRRCDMRGSALAYSGSMGNAVRIVDNHIYGNTAGIATDSLSASGHPGFPADSVVIERNYIYANNLNLYVDKPPVRPRVQVPIGTGIIWGGHNNGRVRNNYIFDNWRRGTMLTAVPDAIVEPEGDVLAGISCPTAKPESDPVLSTSCGNRYHDNVMGQAPPGFEYPEALDQFGVPHGRTGGPLPNGVDFWWDEFPGNTGNCWYDNVGPDGTRASLTGDPALAPVAGTSLPKRLPEHCGTSMGFMDVAKEMTLVDCAGLGAPPVPGLECEWFTAPARPGSAEARRRARRYAAAARRAEASPPGAQLREELQRR